MKITSFLTITLLSAALFTGIKAQIPNGTWRDHLPYSVSKYIAEAGNKIYCSTSGGLFSVNKKDNSVQKYSKVNGLSDVTISIIGYSENTSTLVIGYDNCNLDLIKNDEVINIPDIKEKIFSGDKYIYNIMFLNRYAYLSTGFGIVVIDLDKNEVKDTYLFGDQGGQIKVNATTFDGQNIVAATDNGIYRADINSPNLVDYQFWDKIDFLPLEENMTYKSVVYFGDKLMALYQNTTDNRARIMIISENQYSYWNKYAEEDYTGQLQVYNNFLHVAYKNGIYIYNTSLEDEYGATWGWPHMGLYDKDRILWIADIYAEGLVKSDHGVYTTGFAPNGPRYRDVGEIVYQNDHIWVAGGNEASKWMSTGACLFKDEKWTSFNRETIPALTPVLNIAEIAVDPKNADHIFGGSLGYGVIELDVNNNVVLYDTEDGVLEPISGTVNDVRVVGMNYDQKGNLWISTTASADPLYVVRPDGTWEHIQLKYTGFSLTIRVGDVYPNSYGDIWLLVEREGILVLHENEDGSIDEKFFTVKNQKGEQDYIVYSITEDLEGDMWIGTNKGPLVYYKPVIDFSDNSTLTGTQILIPREGAEVRNGEVEADPLLQFERINCIEVDGGNRKWIATERSGVFLMSEDGKKEIQRFNTLNSPLFSDNVVSVAINKKNGEVFFGTDKGILSYGGQATEGKRDYDDVYVYPNPVRENYEGDITVTGLMENTKVKITDVSGNLVFETTSLGGQAIWDGRNFRGQRVYTGVYLVFCSNEDGTKTHVTKLLFIH